MCGNADASDCRDEFKLLGWASANVRDEKYASDNTCPDMQFYHPGKDSCSYWRPKGANFPCTFVQLASSYTQEIVGGSEKENVGGGENCPSNSSTSQYTCSEADFRQNLLCKDVYHTDKQVASCYNKTWSEAVSGSVPRCANNNDGVLDPNWNECWASQPSSFKPECARLADYPQTILVYFSRGVKMERMVRCFGVQKYSINCCF